MIKINEKLWVFPSTKNSNKISSWWLETEANPALIDCPLLDQPLIDNLQGLAAGRSPLIILTSRDAHSNFKKFREIFPWGALLQEQEAYLLPDLKGIQTFSQEYLIESGLKVLWTPGPTPGSCIVYAPAPSNVLFCGRLLIPDNSKKLIALRTKTTFHWSMQLKSLRKMIDWLPPNSFPSLASGGTLDSLDDGKLLPWQAWNQSKSR